MKRELQLGFEEESRVLRSRGGDQSGPGFSVQTESRGHRGGALVLALSLALLSHFTLSDSFFVHDVG